MAERTYDEQLNRLKEILAVPTFFKQEHKLLTYIVKYLRTTPYSFDIDVTGNLYITKGEADWYPCVCAHTDSVQKHQDIEIHEVTYKDKLRLIGKKTETGNQCGIGADDKAGVFVCLELLDILPAIKVALFTGEEFGCVGSQHADPKFFENVGYVMEFDCPGNSDITFYCNGIQLFDPKGEFYQKVQPILESKMPNEVVMHKHPYTDVWPLKRMFPFSCINIGTGYYAYHTDNEYVIVKDVFNAIDMGKEIINSLGCSFYEFKPQLNELTQYDYVIGRMKNQYPEVFKIENSYTEIMKIN
jgi:tripeptide aminopeptidase